MIHPASTSLKDLICNVYFKCLSQCHLFRIKFIYHSTAYFYKSIFQGNQFISALQISPFICLSGFFAYKSDKDINIMYYHFCVVKLDRLKENLLFIYYYNKIIIIAYTILRVNCKVLVS